MFLMACNRRRNTAALFLSALVWCLVGRDSLVWGFCLPSFVGGRGRRNPSTSSSLAFKNNKLWRPSTTDMSPTTQLWVIEKTPRKSNGASSSSSRAAAAKTIKKKHRQRMQQPRRRRRDIPKRAVHLYMDYATRLWNETNPEARRRIANSKAAAALRQVQHILRGDEYTQAVTADIHLHAPREQLLDACDDLLAAMGNQTFMMTREMNGSGVVATTVATPNPSTTLTTDTTMNDEIKRSTALATQKEGQEETSSMTPKNEKKNRRSILFGATMGLCVAAWVFSGNYIFTGLFTLMTILGQLEYYRMIINTGVYPARRISVVGACTMFLTALFVPDYHQICLPLFGLWAMIWFLTMRRKPPTIPEIATTFTGMFYLGYVPSFWVRIRLLGANKEPTRLAPIAEPVLRFIQNNAQAKLPSFVPSAVHLPITGGAIFIFWTWLCLAFSDVGAYFVGKFHGKTELGTLCPAAGATSPNKTVEGVLGGCAVSAALGVLGAWVQKWPLWPWTGAIHGTLLALLGLLGDLSASMLKRDAGLKDFGDLLPEHGGVIDRVDSFIWSAPYSWLVYTAFLPALRKWVC